MQTKNQNEIAINNITRQINESYVARAVLLDTKIKLLEDNIKIYHDQENDTINSLIARLELVRDENKDLRYVNYRLERRLDIVDSTFNIDADESEEEEEEEEEDKEDKETIAELWDGGESE
jgi:hypothetical protein